MSIRVHDLTHFSMADMAECGSALRRLGHGAASMEEAAEKIVHYLYEQAQSTATGQSAFALVRLFKTHAYSELDTNLQRFARQLLGREPASSTKCLTLLGTMGHKPEWCDRSLSVGHKAIPLDSEEAVARIPMIRHLVKQFGVEVQSVLDPDPELLADLSQKTFNVFHVPEAENSPYIPAQREFVIPENIRSCLGFGGMLPLGDLFAVIMFARVPISHDTASMFKTLSLSVKVALLPFQANVFTDRPQVAAERTAP